MSATAAVELLDADVQFEDELAHTPYAVNTWAQYAASKGQPRARHTIYERALKLLPGSYKLWHAYLSSCIAMVAKKCVTSRDMEVVNNTFERALVFMHKMPVIWIMYCDFLVKQHLLTRTRHVFDRALQALPITQHHRVWPLYLDFVRAAGVWVTCVRVYRRYLQFDPSGREQYVKYLLSIHHFDEAAANLAIMLNDEHFVSSEGQSKHAMWMQLCDIVSKNPRSIHSVRVDPVLRSGCKLFTDEVGRMWCALAEYYVRLTQFEKARDVYEEALEAVTTVRDFATVFDAYTQFEEALLTIKLQQLEAAPEEHIVPIEGVAAAQAGLLTSLSDLDDLGQLTDAGDDVELRMARLELLMDRRPILLSAVLLRQNPHNVTEWTKRAGLFQAAGASSARVVATFNEAVQTVKPSLAVGKVHTLWAEYAKYHEKAGRLAEARAVFARAVGAAFKSVEDLAAVWCEWAELEIRAGAYREALSVIERATRERGGRGVAEEAGSAVGGAAAEAAYQAELRTKLSRNLRVWGLYLDLECSLSDVPQVKAAYERVISMKVATPAMILNYATYLEERSFFEDSFKAYERGVAVFPWPHVKEIWIAYLTRFIARYGGAKMERARELFEQAVAGCPSQFADTMYQLYADTEETYGFVRHAMAVYDRAVSAVDDEHRYAMFVTYIRKCEEFYGAPRTREIYARAVEALPEAHVKDMCMRWAAMETKLGEISRARGIYTHAANFCDPRVHTAFWKTWGEFETAHGNEDTYREMLRLSRSVAAKFSSAGTAIAELAALAGSKTGAGATAASGKSSGNTVFVPAGTLKSTQQAAAGGSAVAGTKRPPAVAGAGGGGDAGEQAPPAKQMRVDSDEIDLEEQAVPGGVFGGLRADAPAMGARERFRAAAHTGSS